MRKKSFFTTTSQTFFESLNFLTTLFHELSLKLDIQPLQQPQMSKFIALFNPELIVVTLPKFLKGEKTTQSYI